MRVGLGFDVHRFGEGDHMMLGGVRIPHAYRIIAHSDGDVLLHAFIDALLGAAGLGDIGQHFPDADPQYAAIDSRILLRNAYALVVGDGWQLGNADITVITQAPKIAPYREAIINNIVDDLQVQPKQINIKATTTEGLGFTGRGEGIAAQVVVMLKSKGSE